MRTAVPKVVAAAYREVKDHSNCGVIVIWGIVHILDPLPLHTPIS